MQPIDQLLQARLDDTSVRELAAKMGDPSVYRNIAKLAAGDLRTFPRPETISAIAKVLSISERDCVLAVAQLLGLDVREGAP